MFIVSEGAQGAPDTWQVEHLGPGESSVGSRGDGQAGRRVALRLDTDAVPRTAGAGGLGEVTYNPAWKLCGLESLPSGPCACACPPRPGLGARCGPRGGRAQSEGAGKGEARQRA